MNNRVLVVHGGFADSTDLEYIKTIDRGKVIISHFVYVYFIYQEFSTSSMFLFFVHLSETLSKWIKQSGNR